MTTIAVAPALADAIEEFLEAYAAIVVGVHAIVDLRGRIGMFFREFGNRFDGAELGEIEAAVTIGVGIVEPLGPLGLDFGLVGGNGGGASGHADQAI